MSRRLVSVCILALAGITSVAAGRFGVNKRQAFPPESQFRNDAFGRSLRVDGGDANQPRMGAATSHRSAPISIPMTFEPNVGQFDARVRYVGRGAGMTLLLTRKGIDVETADLSDRAVTQRIDVVRIRLGWAGLSNRRLKDSAEFSWRGVQQLKAVSNYFIGRNPRKWRTGVRHFARAIGQEDSDGRVGITVYGTSNGVEYDLRLLPGADATKLRLRFSAAKQLELSGGDVILHAAGRELRMAKPTIFAELDGGARTLVRGEYVMEADGSVGFRIGPHDPRATLVIDPSLMVTYATFLGGAGNETAGNVAVDSNGKVYVSGATTSTTTFPEGSAASVGPVVGASAFYVAKIDPTVTGANSLVYLTFLGGSGAQTGGLIALDGTGDVAITGTTTSTDFPVTGYSQPTSGLISGSGNDAVVSEINAQGNQLNFSAYFGGSGEESANGTGGIAVDQLGNVYIASDTQPSAVDPASPDLPLTTGAFQSSWDGEHSDGYLAVFAPPAQAGGAPSLTYCTYLGTYSAGPAAVGGLAVDSNDDAYVAGTTSNPSYGFPVLNAFQRVYGGGTSDGFVMKIAPAGQGSADLVYATLLGGSGMDEILGIALDPPSTLPVGIPPRVYVTGATQSTNFPVNGLNAAYQSKLCASLCGPSPQNGFIAVIAQDAVSGQASLAYSSYLGGSETDEGLSIAVAAADSVYVAGQTNSPDFPWHDNLQPFNGGADAFLAKFDPTLSGAASLIYSTPLAGTSPPGGAVSAAVSGVAVSGTGQVYVTGQTTAADFPTAITSSGAQANGFQQQCSSCQAATPSSDSFLLAISESDAPDPSVYFSAGTVILGTYSLGSPGTPQPVAVLNGGDPASTLTISSVDLVGPNAGDFSVQIGPACLDVPIAPTMPSSSPTCSMEIGFTPTVGGPEQALLAITDNAPGSPQLLELKGTGDAPHAQVSPLSLNFGNQPVNSASNIQTSTITNSGNQSLTIAELNQSGDTTDFYPTGGSCRSSAALAPDQFCTIGMAFDPQSAGTFQTQVTILDNSDLQSNAQQVVTLTGTGVSAAPAAQVSPAALTFENTLVDATSGSQIVTLQNQGSVALDVSAIAIAGTDFADFEIAPAGTTCPIAGGTVAGAGQCTIAVQFAPQSPGASDTATLTVTDNTSTSPQTVALTGYPSLTAPVATVSPAALAFQATPVGTTSALQTAKLQNSGNDALDVTAIAITGANAADFTIAAAEPTTCQPPSGTVAALGQCSVAVQFSPRSPGASKSASLTFTDTSSTSPQTVALTGTALAPGAAVTPTALTFQPTPVGATSFSQTVTLQNAGNATLDATAIAITGTNAADFNIAAAGTTCPSAGGTVAAAGQCTVAVQFAPQSSGDSKKATLTFTDNASTSPQTVALTGIATSPPSFTVSPANLAFGSQGEGTTSAAQSVTITNSGSGTAGPSGIAIAGSTEFAQQNACPPVLSAGAQCQVSVTFAPAESAAAGARSGTLKIPGGTPATVSLSGTATQPTISFTTSVNFAPQLVGTAGAPQPITITNSSSGTLAGTLAFTGISIGGTNKSDFALTANQCETGANASIAPGSSCAVQIAFQPQAAATCGDDPNRSASLQLQDNAPGVSQTIALTGSAADFCMALGNGQPVTAPIQPGQTASYALEIASTGGFTGTMSLSCTAPSGDEVGPCAIVTNPASNPASVQVTPAAPGQFTVNVPTVASSAVSPRGVQPTAGTSTRLAPIIGVGIVCLLLLSGAIWSQRGGLANPSSRLVRCIQIAGIVVGLALGMTACGSGGGGNDPAASVSNLGTPPGTYTIIVTATTTSAGTPASKTASLILTVE